MESEIIEPKPELRLLLIPAPEEPPLRSPEFQKELGAFMQTLKANGIDVSWTSFAYDAVGVAGWSTGAFVLPVATLGSVAIVELRKLIEAFLKMREGRRLKLKYGPLTLEGRAQDVEKLVTREQIAKMLESPKKFGKKTG